MLRDAALLLLPILTSPVRFTGLLALFLSMMSIVALNSSIISAVMAPLTSGAATSAWSAPRVVSNRRSADSKISSWLYLNRRFDGVGALPASGAAVAAARGTAVVQNRWAVGGTSGS